MMKRIAYLLVIVCLAPQILHAKRHQQLQINTVASLISQAEAQQNNPTRAMLDELKALEWYYWHAPTGMFGAINSRKLYPKITELIQAYESKLGSAGGNSSGALKQCDALVEQVKKMPQKTVDLQPLIDEVEKIKATIETIKV